MLTGANDLNARFAQVMKELKRVEGQSFDVRAAAQQEEYVMGGQEMAADSQPEQDTDADLEPLDNGEEKRKTSAAGTKKKPAASAKTTTGPASKSAKPEQKKLADKVGEVKRAASVKIRPVKTQVSDLGQKNTAPKIKPALKKTMSVTQTPKSKPDVGRTKSLGPKSEKKAPPPTAPKPGKVDEEAKISEAQEDIESAGPTKGPAGHLADQKSNNPSAGAGRPSNGSKTAAKTGLTGGGTRANIPPPSREKKGLGVGGSAGPKKEGLEKKDTAAKKRPTAEKSKEAVPPRSKPAVARPISSPAEVKSTGGVGGGSIRKKGTPAVGDKSGKAHNTSAACAAPGDGDSMSQSPPAEPVTAGAPAGRRIPPTVPPKPSSPNKSRISANGADGSITPLPGVGHKSSLAERARLVGAIEVRIHPIYPCHLRASDQVADAERSPTTHFVSSARATLSPIPGRKVLLAQPLGQELGGQSQEKKEEIQESGIVETSIKASSVIKQFETRKISKIKPDAEVFGGKWPVGCGNDPSVGPSRSLLQCPVCSWAPRAPLHCPGNTGPRWGQTGPVPCRGRGHSTFLVPPAQHWPPAASMRTKNGFMGKHSGALMARIDQYDGSLASCHYGWVERWLRWRVGTFPGGLIRSLSPGAGLHHSVCH